MKHRIIALVIIGLLLLALSLSAAFNYGVATASGTDRTAGHTYHWQLNKNDDAYILCAACRFDIEINGDNSIHIVPVHN